jgi:hypothetical protein
MDIHGHPCRLRRRHPHTRKHHPRRRRPPPIGPNYFARGRVEFGDGAAYQSRAITASTALTAGVLALTPS